MKVWIVIGFNQHGDDEIKGVHMTSDGASFMSDENPWSYIEEHEVID